MFHIGVEDAYFPICRDVFGAPDLLEHVKHYPGLAGSALYFHICPFVGVHDTTWVVRASGSLRGVSSATFKSLCLRLKTALESLAYFNPLSSDSRRLSSDQRHVLKEQMLMLATTQWLYM